MDFGWCFHSTQPKFQARTVKAEIKFGARFPEPVCRAPPPADEPLLREPTSRLSDALAGRGCVFFLKEGRKGSPYLNGSCPQLTKQDLEAPIWSTNTTTSHAADFIISTRFGASQDVGTSVSSTNAALHGKHYTASDNTLSVRSQGGLFGFLPAASGDSAARGLQCQAEAHGQALWRGALSHAAHRQALGGQCAGRAGANGGKLNSINVVTR